MQIRLSQQKSFRQPFNRRREVLPLSLKDLAFYSFVGFVVMAIWPSARLAALAYEATGLVTLFAFMGFVFALAIALGVMVVKLLSGSDGDT